MPYATLTSMKRSLGLIAFFISNFLIAQTDSTQKHPLILKIAPLALLDPQTPVLLVGMEYIFHSHWGLEGNIGVNPFVTNATKPVDTYVRFDDHPSYNQYQLKLKSEVRYYLSKKRTPKGVYFALEMYYVFVRAERDDFHYQYEKVANIVYEYDHARIIKNLFGNNLKFGGQVMGRRFGMDMFVGVGYRISSTHYKTRNRSIDASGVNSFGKIENTEVAGTHIWPNLSLGFKYVYRLR